MYPFHCVGDGTGRERPTSAPLSPSRRQKEAGSNTIAKSTITMKKISAEIKTPSKDEPLSIIHPQSSQVAIEEKSPRARAVQIVARKEEITAEVKDNNNLKVSPAISHQPANELPAEVIQ